ACAESLHATSGCLDAELPATPRFPAVRYGSVAAVGTGQPGGAEWHGGGAGGLCAVGLCLLAVAAAADTRGFCATSAYVAGAGVSVAGGWHRGFAAVACGWGKRCIRRACWCCEP